VLRTGRPPSPKTETNELVSYNLGRAREAAGLTQPDASAVTGIALSTLQKHERKKGSKAGNHLLPVYAAAYGVSIDALYTPRDQEMPKPRAPATRPAFDLAVAPGARISRGLLERAYKAIAALNAEAMVDRRRP